MNENSRSATNPTRLARVRAFSFIRVSALVGAILLVSGGCDSTEPSDPGAGEEELITLVRLALETTGGAPLPISEAAFDEAGVLQRIDTLLLSAGATYDGEIELQNTTVSPPEIISNEIRLEEPHAHQFFYIPEGGIAHHVTISTLDLDSNGDPLGITFMLSVSGGSGTDGHLRLKLRHYSEDATLPRDKRSDTATSPEVPGVVENDLDLVFPVWIE